jgi:predicted nucleic acid-binding protein
LRFFLDANIFIYAATEGPRSEACSGLLDRVSEGGADAATSVAAIEEVWHFELTRGGPAAAGLAANALSVMDAALPVTLAELELAFSLPAGDAGANDRLHVATCVLNEIPVIVSADRDFDEFDEVRRVDPLDADAVAELLA